MAGADLLATVQARCHERRMRDGVVSFLAHGARELAVLVLGLVPAWRHSRRARASRQPRASALRALFADTGYALRRFRKNPGYALVIVARISANFFDLLGVEPILGRTFRPGEDEPGSPWVVILSHRFWQRSLGGDPDVVGRRITVGYPEMEIIGVLPEDFRFALPEQLGSHGDADLWIPMWHGFNSDGRLGGVHQAVIGRVVPDRSMGEVEAELDALGRAEDAQHFGGRGFRFRAQPVHADVIEAVRPTLIVLAAAVGFVLLIAAANVATLVLARTQLRSGELALRHSLGASRARISRQLLTESLALALPGGLLGVGVAVAGAGLLAGIAPMLHARGGDLSAALHVGSVSGTDTRRARIRPRGSADPEHLPDGGV